MNLFKKVIATIALLTLVSANVVTSVSAYSQSSLEAANTLASQGIINDHSSDPAAYNLDQNVLRQEIAAVTMGVAGLTKKTTCDNEFSDVSATTPNTWVCYVAETLRDNNMIAANAKFNPEANITKAEALGMVVKAAFSDGYSYDSTLSTNWQEQLVAFASENGIVAAFTDYNTPATRGWVFEVAVASMDAASMADGGDDILCELLGTCEDNTDNNTDTDTDTGSNPTGSSVMVELSPETPASATVPQGISGLPVAAFDFTAGSEDVTVNSLILKRRGLSDANTLTGLAAFTQEGRASKAKNDSQNNNTEATLTLDNGGVVVKAGETVTITIVADVNTGTTSDEFAIELVSVDASADVEGLDNLVANTMRVWGVEAETLTITKDGTFSNPKIGEEGADLFKFKLVGSNNRDIILKSITFKGEGSIDEGDELANYRLLHGTTVVAETAMANGKYVTFNLGEGITIPEDQNERFSVQADVLGGAGKTSAWKVDKTLDVTAIDTLYGYNTNVNIDDVNDADGVTMTITANELGIQTIQAGELTLVDVDAPSDKIRSNKTNVELGSINVTNISGNNLELQKFGVNVTLSNVGTFTGWLAGTFENFEAVVGGTSYELTTSAGTANTGSYGDTDLSISLPQGTTKITLRADTKENLPTGMKVDITLTSVNTQFYVVELGDDKQVTDLTPSSLSFKQLEVLGSAATASVTPTADLKVVRGAKGVVAEIFTVKASEASDLTMDEAKVAFTMSGAAVATPQEIAKVSLYKDSVSASNLLDQVSGSQLASGVATFNGFTVDVAANQTRTFVVTIDFVDSDTVASKSDFTAKVTNLSLYDDETDDVFANGGTSSTLPSALVSTTAITVTDSWVLSVDYDANNTDNKNPKSVLAGSSAIVYSADVYSTNESVDVEKVVFTLSQTGSDIQSAIANASLYLDGKLVDTNSNADIDQTAGTITFDSLTNLIVPENNVELALKLNTSSIGYQKVGKTLTGVYVTDVLLTTATGDQSGKPVAQQNDGTNGNTFEIVPSVLNPAVKSSFGTKADLEISVNSGDNTQTGSNSAPVVTINSLTFTDVWNTASIVYKVKDSDGNVIGTWASTGWDLTINVSGTKTVFSSKETYTIEAVIPTTSWNYTWWLTLKRNGISYTTNVDGASVVLTNNTLDVKDLGSSSQKSN